MRYMRFRTCLLIYMICTLLFWGCARKAEYSDTLSTSSTTETMMPETTTPEPETTTPEPETTTPEPETTTSAPSFDYDAEVGEILSDSGNYQKGWYESWGGKYKEGGGSLCTKDYIMIGDAEEYYLSVNDSRIVVSIHEYNADKTWIKYTDELSNGSKFKKQEKTEYIKITIASKEWGVDIWSLFDIGFEIKFSTDKIVNENTIVTMEQADFSNVLKWNKGDYSRITGKLALATGSYAYGEGCYVTDDYYVVKLPQGKFKLRIVEVSAEGSVVKTSTLTSGYKWKKQEDTEYIMLSVSMNSNKEFELNSFVSAVQGKMFLEKYDEYRHDTIMQELTAHEFVNIMNVGWNLGNSLDSKSEKRGLDKNLKQELNWGNPYVCKELIDYVAECGFNTIRIPVTWYYNTDLNEAGELVIGEQFLQRVQEVVDYAIANDLYVILNAHHEQPMFYAGVSETEIQTVYKNAEELWTQIAEHFKTYDEQLIFEAYNEVDNLELSWSYGDTAAAQMNHMNQIFVDAVRATGGNNSSRILIVPTLLDGTNSKILNAFVIPNDAVDNRIVVEVHSYAEKFSELLESDFIELEKFSDKIGAPVIIGEFGTTTSYEFAELRAVHAANFVARAVAHGIKCIWWDNGSNYAIINRKDYAASNTEIIQGLMDGAAGKNCTLGESMYLNQPEQYEEGSNMLGVKDSEKGDVVFSHWGTIVTKEFSVNEGRYCIVSLKAVEGATEIWLQRIAFYNKDGEVLPLLVKDGVTHYVKEIQKRYYVCEVPKGATTVRVSMNSAYTNIRRELFDEYLANGELELTINFFDVEDVELQ